MEISMGQSYTILTLGEYNSPVYQVEGGYCLHYAIL